MITREEAQRLIDDGKWIFMQHAAETIVALYDKIDEMAIQLGEKTEEIMDLEVQVQYAADNQDGCLGTFPKP